ncbi:hypothetical protein [Fodinicola feengrottensis]|uniref:Uncharacterized protein n=1 Tax=Fodinicola feengrottensis TaxID=435914 RepID=A0ABP4VF43_9ACTN|nr:hypothetical protein [Fodinicola feengrottensis]
MADGSGNIDGYTDAMESFSPQPPPAAQAAQVTGTGMAELQTYATACNQAFQKVTQYVTQAQHGFAAYKSIASSAAGAYLHHDSTSAAGITNSVFQDSPVLRGPGNVPLVGGK